MSEGKILNQKFSRRELLRKAVLGGTGIVAASALAACATPTPQVIKETVVVEKPVEKVVTATPSPTKIELEFLVPGLDANKYREPFQVVGDDLRSKYPRSS